MASPETREWVEEVTANTKSGSITWKASNPSTYVWDTQSPKPTKVVLQRFERQQMIRTAQGNTVRKIFTYLLVVSDATKTPPLPVININGTDKFLTCSYK